MAHDKAVSCCDTLPADQRCPPGAAIGSASHSRPVQLLVADGYNHFEILETLANPYGLLGRAVLEQMKLSG